MKITICDMCGKDTGLDVDKYRVNIKRDIVIPPKTLSWQFDLCDECGRKLLDMFGDIGYEYVEVRNE